MSIKALGGSLGGATGRGGSKAGRHAGTILWGDDSAGCPCDDVDAPL